MEIKFLFPHFQGVKILKSIPTYIIKEFRTKFACNSAKTVGEDKFPENPQNFNKNWNWDKFSNP